MKRSGGNVRWSSQSSTLEILRRPCTALASEILKYRRALQLAGSGDRLGVRRPPAEFGVIGAFADPKGQLRPPSPTTG